MTGILLVKHSQTDVVPECYPGHPKLWEGYSLMSMEGNGTTYTQDLGQAGSCIRKFSAMPFLNCDSKYGCKYASSNEYSIWLSTKPFSEIKPAGIFTLRITEYISRCVVCEVPSTVIAVHSQSATVPDCPDGWEGLWIGYSFAMHALQNAMGGGQSLVSPGSCLENFLAKPFIECTDSIIRAYKKQRNFWLASIDLDQVQSPKIKPFNKDNVLHSVSRCQVCIKAV